MSGFIYLWYDRKHKRYYLGKHWGTVDDGYVCSSKWMKQAYSRRPQDFKRRILEWVDKRENLSDAEHRWGALIKEEELGKRYYNLKIPKDRHWHDDPDNLLSVKQKISNSRKGKYTGPRTEEHKQAISEAKKASFEKRRAKHGYNYSPDVKSVWDNRAGYKHTEEWKQQNALRTKEQWASGQRKSNGPLSEEHKKKQSEALRGRKLSTTQVEQIRQRTSKEWIVVSPDGIEHTVKNLKQFCVEHGLANTNITKKCGSKGWKAVKT